MSYSIGGTLTEANSNTKMIFCDTEGDIKDIPLTVAPGSMAKIIGTGDEYVLNTKREWVKQGNKNDESQFLKKEDVAQYINETVAKQYLESQDFVDIVDKSFVTHTEAEAYETKSAHDSDMLAVKFDVQEHTNSILSLTEDVSKLKNESKNYVTMEYTNQAIEDAKKQLADDSSYQETKKKVDKLENDYKKTQEAYATDKAYLYSLPNNEKYSELTNAIEGVVKQDDLSVYLKKSDASTYATREDLSYLAKQSELLNYVKTSQLDDYVLEETFSKTINKMTASIEGIAHEVENKPAIYCFGPGYGNGLHTWASGVEKAIGHLYDIHDETDSTPLESESARTFDHALEIDTEGSDDKGFVILFVQRPSITNEAVTTAYHKYHDLFPNMTLVLLSGVNNVETKFIDDTGAYTPITVIKETEMAKDEWRKMGGIAVDGCRLAFKGRTEMFEPDSNYDVLTEDGVDLLGEIAAQAILGQKYSRYESYSSFLGRYESAPFTLTLDNGIVTLTTDKDEAMTQYKDMKLPIWAIPTGRTVAAPVFYTGDYGSRLMISGTMDENMSLVDASGELLDHNMTYDLFSVSASWRV